MARKTLLIAAILLPLTTVSLFAANTKAPVWTFSRAELISWGCAAAFLIMLVLGASNRVIIYFNTADLVLSFLPWPIAIAGIAFLAKWGQIMGQKYTIILSALLVIIVASLLIYSIYLSVKYNKSIFVGLLIGVFKLVASLLAFLFIWTQFGDHESSQDTIIKMILLGILIWIGFRLVNGHAVYERRGWAIPDAGS